MNNDHICRAVEMQDGSWNERRLEHFLSSFHFEVEKSLSFDFVVIFENELHLFVYRSGG
jgi:hypothetical protein